MFSAYPAVVRARLGTLTREHKILSGSELIALGVRDCNAPKSIEPRPGEQQTLVASAKSLKIRSERLRQEGGQTSFLANLVGKVAFVFGASDIALGQTSEGRLNQPRASLNR